MSIQLMGAAWEESVPLPQKLVLLKIADAAGDNGAFKVDQLAAAKACRIDEAEFIRCIASLESDGLLRLKARTCGPLRELARPHAAFRERRTRTRQPCSRKL